MWWLPYASHMTVTCSISLCSSGDPSGSYTTKAWLERVIVVGFPSAPNSVKLSSGTQIRISAHERIEAVDFDVNVCDMYYRVRGSSIKRCRQVPDTLCSMVWEIKPSTRLLYACYSIPRPWVHVQGLGMRLHACERCLSSSIFSFCRWWEWEPSVHLWQQKPGANNQKTGHQHSRGLHNHYLSQLVCWGHPDNLGTIFHVQFMT